MVYLSDPSDPTYDAIEKISCFSSPLSGSTFFQQTIQQATENFLGPITKNRLYLDRQPRGIRYIE